MSYSYTRILLTLKTNITEISYLNVNMLHYYGDIIFWMNNGRPVFEIDSK